MLRTKTVTRPILQWGITEIFNIVYGIFTREDFCFVLKCHVFLLSLVGHLFLDSPFVTSNSITALRCTESSVPTVPSWPACVQGSTFLSGIMPLAGVLWSTCRAGSSVCSWSASCSLSWGYQEGTGARGKGPWPVTDPLKKSKETCLTMCVCEECRESSRAPITGASHGEWASVPAVTVSGDGKVIDRVDPECSDRKVLLTGRF